VGIEEVVWLWLYFRLVDPIPINSNSPRILPVGSGTRLLSSPEVIAMMYQNIRSKIIKNPIVFSETYWPKTLPVREKEAQLIIQRIYNRIKGGGGTEVISITGSMGTPGIGKTTLAMYSAIKLKELAKRSGIKFEYVKLNMHVPLKLNESLRIIINQLNSNINVKGLSNLDILKAIVDYLYINDTYLLIILDEFQGVLKAADKLGIDENVLYVLLRIHEEVPLPDNINRIFFIIISNSEIAMAMLRHKLPQVYSQITLNFYLRPYTPEELYYILEQRAVEGLVEGSWTPEILMMIAEEYGVTRRDHRLYAGNARSAIYALYRAAEEAELEGSPVITEKHVRVALGKDSRALISLSDLELLSLHELILLYAIAMFTFQEGGWATTGTIKKYYEEAVEYFGEKPRGHTQFNQYLHRLKAADLIQMKPSGKGMRGRTSLIRLVPDIVADDLLDLLPRLIEAKKKGVAHEY